MKFQRKMQTGALSPPWQTCVPSLRPYHQHSRSCWTSITAPYRHLPNPDHQKSLIPQRPQNTSHLSSFPNILPPSFFKPNAHNNSASTSRISLHDMFFPTRFQSPSEEGLEVGHDIALGGSQRARRNLGRRVEVKCSVEWLAPILGDGDVGLGIWLVGLPWG